VMRASSVPQLRVGETANRMRIMGPSVSSPMQSGAFTAVGERARPRVRLVALDRCGRKTDLDLPTTPFYLIAMKWEGILRDCFNDKVLPRSHAGTVE
jgi:hypothetical protein